MVRQCIVARVSMSHPGDASQVERLIAEGVLAPDEIVAILGKTEGNGCVNDFTRGYATDTLKQALASRLGVTPEEVGQRIAMIMSGGTEGALSPHFLVVGVRMHPDGAPAASNAAVSAPTASRLAVGTAFSQSFRPEEIGRLTQVEATASAVAEAIENAGISSADDVHWVQVKCPLLTADRVAEAKARGQATVTEETYKSMAYSRAASALGVALALGEVEKACLSDSSIGRDASLWSSRASASAGIELMRNEVLVFGNAESWVGDAVIAHAVMHDPIDIAAVRSVLRTLGFDPGDQLAQAESERVLAVLAKAEPSRDGLIRGYRHIMWDDSDINATRHGRAVVGGVVSAAIGHSAIFVSGGAEHQGPDGGGPIAIIARTEAAGAKRNGSARTPA